MKLSSFNDAIIRPIITEKTNSQKVSKGQVSFEVARHVNRIDVARSIEKIFGVKVNKVRTIIVKGKVKRRGKIVGRRKSWKKAIVSLVPGEVINFFEGV